MKKERRKRRKTVFRIITFLFPVVFEIYCLLINSCSPLLLLLSRKKRRRERKRKKKEGEREDQLLLIIDTDSLTGQTPKDIKIFKFLPSLNSFSPSFSFFFLFFFPLSSYLEFLSEKTRDEGEKQSHKNFLRKMREKGEKIQRKERGRRKQEKGGEKKEGEERKKLAVKMVNLCHLFFFTGL